MLGSKLHHAVMAGLVATAAFGTAVRGGQDIVDTAVKAGSFKTLAAALEAADLVDALRGEGPFTVFAPTDEAFAKLPKGTVESLLKPGNRAQLQAILKYHVISGRVSAQDGVSAGAAATLEGSKIRVSLKDGRLRINDAQVIQNDVSASNGLIHVIDSVLIPASAQASGRKVIGVYTGRPGKALAAQLGLPDGTGIVVTGLTRSGPARAAGVMQYDVIAQIDGDPATSKILDAAKRRTPVGDTLELAMFRGGTLIRVDVPIGVSKH